MDNTQKIIKNKMGLLNLAEELGNVSKACKIMGYSRDTFYRYKQLVDEGGFENLVEANRRKPNTKNRVSSEVEQAVREIAIQFPAYGQVRASNELRKKGIFISAGGIRSVWMRQNLETMKKRLVALEQLSAAEGTVLTEAQVAALEKKKEDDVAHGEIETEHPGYLGSQDTFYVGTMKGVGRVYQQTFGDTYSKGAICKLYTSKTPITSADLLNDRVIPFFDSHRTRLLRILTDRGTEYCGKPETHDYQLFLALSDVEHTKTKVRHPQTNGICERFHRTVLDEFYRVTLRRKIYTDLESLQKDLDVWLHEYNNERTHQGKMWCGRTPMETFYDGVKIANEKYLN